MSTVLGPLVGISNYTGKIYGSHCNFFCSQEVPVFGDNFVLIIDSILLFLFLQKTALI